MQALTELDLETFMRLVYVWGAIGILSPLGIYLSKQLPLSSRYADRSRESDGVLASFGTIDKRLGWIIMETPILISVSYFYLVGKIPINASAVIVGAFVFHYIHRALIFPHRIKVAGKTMPVGTVLASMGFYIVNGYLVGHYFGSLKAYPLEWLLDPRFLLGAALFVGGFTLNVTSDNILINLRGPGETGYKIPRGGLFRFVSCPNFFGEIIEWTGFAIMSWSLPGLVYAAWVSLALVATGLRTHRWYLEEFGDAYPQKRKALFPFLL